MIIQPKEPDPIVQPKFNENPQTVPLPAEEKVSEITGGIFTDLKDLDREKKMPPKEISPGEIKKSKIKPIINPEFPDVWPAKYENLQRQDAWYSESNMNEYFTFVAIAHPELAVPNTQERMGVPNPENIERWVMRDLEKNPSKKAFAYYLNIGNEHWTLVYVDRKKRTVEYYDSFADENRVKEVLTRVAEKLTDKDSGEKPYEYNNKISKPIQKDSFQCGPLTNYFLTFRVNEDEGPSLNDLSVLQKGAEDYIMHNRGLQISRLISNDEICQAAIAKERQSFKSYFGVNELGNTPQYRQALMKDQGNDDQYQVRRLKNLLEGELLDPKDFDPNI